MQTFTSSVASCFSVEYNVVVLPEPVGPVTSTIPLRRADHRLPARVVVTGESQFLETAQQHVGIENPRDQLFAERGRQRRQAQFDFVAVGAFGLHATVLRPSFFGDIHAAENFQATRDGGIHRRRQLVDPMHHAVDAKPHVAFIAARFDVDVARALIERVLQQPVDDVDDV